MKWMRHYLSLFKSLQNLKMGSKFHMENPLWKNTECRQTNVHTNLPHQIWNKIKRPKFPYRTTARCAILKNSQLQFHLQSPSWYFFSFPIFILLCSFIIIHIIHLVLQLPTPIFFNSFLFSANKSNFNSKNILLARLFLSELRNTRCLYKLYYLGFNSWLLPKKCSIFALTIIAFNITHSTHRRNIWE